MSAFILALAAAFWLGVLTAISPCLLATNVTAISFIARRLSNPRYTVVSGLCYMMGQAAAFVLLAVVLIKSLLSLPIVSFWLQEYMFRLLGPILVICAVLLLELLDFKFGDGRIKQWAQRHAGSGGLWAAALLGIVFAMSFCPTTAALFFGNLIPLAVSRQSTFLLPVAYAVGGALPVLAFSLIIAVAAGKVAAAFKHVAKFERRLRLAVGWIFLVVGTYFTLAYTLKLW